MALNNEAYNVSTATAGEIIVPVEDEVSYLNIIFIGFQHYNYHEIMSQNLANIVDDIKGLQDGGQAQASFDLDALVLDTTNNINTQIDDLESSINIKIIDLTNQAVENTNIKLTEFETSLEELTILSDTIGDSSIGLVYQITTLETIVGNNSSGLIQTINSYSTSISDIQTQVNTSESLSESLDLSINGANGLISKVNIIESSLNNVQSHEDRINGDGTYLGLVNLVGSPSGGLIQQSNTTKTNLENYIILADNKISNIQNVLGNLDNSGIVDSVLVLNAFKLSTNNLLGATDTSGLRGKITDLETFNISEIRNTIYNAVTGLVKLVNDNAADIIALSVTSENSNTASTDNITNIDNRVTINTNDISNINANNSSLTTTINNLDAEINTANTGLKDKVNAVSQTITNDLLTFDSGGGDLILTPSILNTMYFANKEVIDSDIVNQFQTYFGTPGNYQNSNQVGSERLNAWISDITSDGFKLKTYDHISSYLNTNYIMNDISNNKNNIAKLNNNISTTGSVLHTINSAIVSYDNTINGASGLITIINGNSSIANSTDNKILESKNNIISTITDPITAEVDNLKIIVDSNTQSSKDQVNELQVEMVRYDTILPFIQTMFKAVNTGNNMTDTEIDNLFNSVSDKVKLLSDNINSSQYKVFFTDNGAANLNTFDISIILDRDLKFSDLLEDNSSGIFARIRRTSDNYIAYGGLESADPGGTNIAPVEIDGSGELIINSGILVTSEETYLYDNISNTAYEVLNLTSPNDTLIFEFGTRDIFDQHKVIQVPIIAR